VCQTFITRVSKQPDGMEEGIVAAADVEGADGSDKVCPGAELKLAEEGGMKGSG